MNYDKNYVKNLFAATCVESYSYSRYGSQAWTVAIENLEVMGYNLQDAEWILRSKLMRWAADAFERVDLYGNTYCIGDEISHYERKFGIKVGK